MTTDEQLEFEIFTARLTEFISNWIEAGGKNKGSRIVHCARVLGDIGSQIVEYLKQYIKNNGSS